MRSSDIVHALRLLIVVGAFTLLPIAHAGAWVPDGSWIVSDRLAIQVFECDAMLCGRIVWLRNPALRTAEMCGRTVFWNLRSNGPTKWGGGQFFDPENGATYDLTASLDSDDMISARIYAGIALFGKTEILRRITPRSLPGWC
jgi:uncharacterized protein (DUF2147 family)